MIIALFMTANVWRGKPWSAIRLPQPLKRLVSFVLIVVVGYALAVLCVKLAPSWLPQATLDALEQKNDLTRFLWSHAAEIAGFTPIPFLAGHHLFDDLVPIADNDSWSASLQDRGRAPARRPQLRRVLPPRIRPMGNWQRTRGPSRAGLPRRRIAGVELLMDHSAPLERMVLPQMAVLRLSDPRTQVHDGRVDRTAYTCATCSAGTPRPPRTAHEKSARVN
jgi:hypothetical protein